MSVTVVQIQSNCSSKRYRRHCCSFVIFDWMRNLLRITLLSRFVHVNWLNWEIWQAVIDKEKNTSNEKNYKICYLAEKILFRWYWALRESYHPIFWIFKNSTNIFEFQGKDVAKQILVMEQNKLKASDRSFRRPNLYFKFILDIHVVTSYQTAHNNQFACVKFNEFNHFIRSSHINVNMSKLLIISSIERKIDFSKIPKNQKPGNLSKWTRSYDPFDMTLW